MKRIIGTCAVFIAWMILLHKSYLTYGIWWVLFSLAAIGTIFAMIGVVYLCERTR
jgi:hypothetical protein